MTVAKDPTPAIPARKRSKVPTVIQMEGVECGPACLAMVLAHYGRFVPLDVLRDECNVGRDGTTALRLAQVARTYGLEAQGYEGDLPDLQQMRTPFIAFWRFNHFVVVEGWNDDGIFVNDPASGPRPVPWAQADSDFTGIAITLKPTPAFRPGGRPMSVLRRIPTLLHGYGWPLAFAALVGLFVAVPGIAAAGFLSFFINRILGDGQVDLLTGFFIAIAVALVAQIGLSWIQLRTLTETTTSLSTSMAAAMAWRTLRLPMRYYTQRSSGEVAWRMSMPDILAAELAGPFPAAVTSATSVVLFFVALFLVSPAVALVALGIGMLDFVVLRVVHGREELGERLGLQAEGRMLTEAASGIAGIEFVKATGAEEDLFDRFTGHHAVTINNRQAVGAVTQLLIAVPSLLRIVASAAAIGIGAFAVLNGSLSIGGLVALQPLLEGFLLPFATFLKLSSTTSHVTALVGKIDDILEQEPEVVGVRTRARPRADDDAEAAPAPAAKLLGDLEFRDVVFGYTRGAAPLLAGLSFRVRPGQRIAVVGTTGAGKSTVSRLLVGLVHPWSGEILIDGVPRAQIAPDVLAASLGFVEQQAVLFSGSTMDNLTLWDASITRDRAVTGARDAAIDDVIASRPGGYDSVIDEGARNISGGEAQRLEIARALTLDPTILVLDEATSALDAGTEVKIDNAIRRRGCTTVIVAHRLSTIRDADLILVLDRGRVVESGTHEELIADGGLYRTLVQS